MAINRDELAKEILLKILDNSSGVITTSMADCAYQLTDAMIEASGKQLIDTKPFIYDYQER